MADGVIVSFSEVQFPVRIAFGAQGGPKFHTTIAKTMGGWEQRNIDWEDARGQWNVAHNLKTQAELDQLRGFFMSMRGQGTGFRFKDWMDYQVTTADVAKLLTTTTFQLQKTYTYSGLTATYIRNIAKPVVGTVKVYKAGVLQSSGYTLDAATGIITFGSAPVGAITWTGEFDVPCRFNTDDFNPTIEFFQTHNWTLEIVELRV